MANQPQATPFLATTEWQIGHNSANYYDSMAELSFSSIRLNWLSQEWDLQEVRFICTNLANHI